MEVTAYEKQFDSYTELMTYYTMFKRVCYNLDIALDSLESSDIELSKGKYKVLFTIRDFA